jgi:hypothetical protein
MKAEEQSREKMCGERGRGMRTQLQEMVPIQRAPRARDYQVSGSRSRKDPPAKDGARQTLSLLFLLPTVFAPHVF